MCSMKQNHVCVALLSSHFILCLSFANCVLQDEQSCRIGKSKRRTFAIVQWDSEVVHGNADEERVTVKEKQEAILEALKGYRHYTFQELQQATDNFSDTMKLGEGRFGAVYKGILQHITVAVKVLRTEGVQGLKELQQEVCRCPSF